MMTDSEDIRDATVKLILDMLDMQNTKIRELTDRISAIEQIIKGR